MRTLPAEELKVLRDRAREAAQRPVAGEVGDLLEILEVNSRGQRFALPLTALEGVAELTTIAAVPRAPAYVRGLVSFRGEVLIGIELSPLIGGAAEGIADLRRVIAVAAGSRKLAILVGHVIAVRAVPQGSFVPDPLAQGSFVSGTNQDFLSLIDPARLIEQALGALGAA